MDSAEPPARPWGRRPEDHEMVPVVMPAGWAVVYSGRLWHGAGNNRSDAPRRALICEHVLPWLRPADNHTLALGVAGLRRLPPMLRGLAGWPGRPTILASSPGRIPRSGSPRGRIDECNHCGTATPTTPAATGGWS